MIRLIRNVNEESVAYANVYFFSKSGAAVTPSAIRYRLDDVTDGLPGTQILDWTSVTPSGTSIELTITAEENEMLSDYSTVERRQLTVEATGTDGEPWREAFEYQVVNVAGTP